ncbi:MAG: hypothetical protein M3Y04_00110 [Actinomycetota bacterium]|nr:hypothetical protein [Actinomycetota bacterium]
MAGVVVVVVVVTGWTDGLHRRPPPRFLLTLVGGDHLSPYDPPDPPAR